MPEDPVGAIDTVDVQQVGQAVGSAISEIRDLATLPSETSAIIQVVDDPHSTPYDLSRVIADDPALTAALNEQIIALKESGKLAELHMEYFGVTFDLPNENFIPAE